MAFEKLTIVPVPKDTKRVLRIRLPSLFLVLTAFACLFGLAFFAFVFDQYFVLKGRMPRLAALEQEVAHRERQFTELAQKIDEIAANLSELKDFDRKLKGIIKPETEEGGAEIGGIGGSVPGGSVPVHAAAQSHEDVVRALHQALDSLDQEVSLRKQERSELQKFLEDQKILLASTPSIWPTKGWVSSRFGYRTSPFNDQREFHRGIDISTRMNAPVVCPADGVVESVSSDPGYGRTLEVNHGFGLLTRYAHLQKALVKPGQYVKRGETIALVGSSGRTTGPHLHYEVELKGVPVDPLRYIIE